MRKKLRSSRGMTLTELLVALAIVSLIGMALTMGINNAAKIYRNSTRLYEAETLCGTILTYLEDEFRFGRNIRSADDGTEVVFDSQVFGNDVKVLLKDGKIKIGESETAGYDLLGTTAYTSGLMVEKCEISYDKSKGLVSITVAVGPEADNAYVSHTVTVAPVDH